MPADPPELDAARRPLPFDDGSVDALPIPERLAIAEVWQGRARSELLVGAQFDRIREALSADAAAPEVLTALEQAVEDERRHAQICAAVSERYSGARTALPTAEVPQLVRFGTADEPVSLLLHVVLLSCVSEVTSTFYLRECMQLARAPLPHAALRELLADDVRHARIGWAHLASDRVPAEARVHVALALPTLLRLSQTVWSSTPDRAEPHFSDHGCAGAATSRRAFRAAVTEVILPGMASVGVDAGPGTRWAEQQLGEAAG